MKKGFTIIEVLLFLSISAMIVMGIIIGTSSSIDQQRYEDSVQNFAERMRTVYSNVNNPKGLDSGNGGGRSDKAIYGKLVTFGENKSNNPDQRIFIYDVIGDADSQNVSGNAIMALKNLKADVIKKDSGSNAATFTNAEGFLLNWDAKVQKTNKESLKAAILIVRSPLSGTTYTYVMKDATVEVQEALKANAANVLLPLLDNFKAEDLDMCIAPEGYTVYGGKRRDVRVFANTHDSSGVGLISLDSSDNKCE